MSDEAWKDVAGYEGYYRVSSFGAVIAVDRYDRYGRHWPARVMSQANDTDGYKVVTLSRDGTRRTARVHRLVAVAFVDNPNNYSEVNHIDEDKTNNCVENLEWCTTQYNLTYGHRLDCVKGEKAPTHKLTEQQVREIRSIYRKRDPEFGQAALARRYGVTHPAIAAIVKFRTWKHVL